VADAWERLLVRLESVGAAVEPERPGLVCFDARGLVRLHGGADGVLAAVRSALRVPARFGIAPSRFAAVADPAGGSNASPVFILRKELLLRIRLKTSRRTIGRTKKGTVGKLDGAPEATFADSSMIRATCSTTWDGDHFPGARGTVQVVPALSAATRSAATAACTPASDAFRSDKWPPMGESDFGCRNPSRTPPGRHQGSAGIFSQA